MTIVYTYYLRPPTVAADLVAQQMVLAHRYYNDLIAIERDRLAAVRAVLSADAEVECLEAWVAQVREDRDAARDAIKRSRSAARARVDTEEQRGLVRDLTDQLREVAAICRSARKALFADQDFIAAVGDINVAAGNRSRQARAECGCYCGTYQCVEQAAGAACSSAKFDPAFRRWDGSGTVGVQVRGNATVEKLGAHRMLQIDVPDASAWDRRRDPRTRTTVRVRVGSSGRDPVWAEWPLLMHRPLPRGCTITWARVRRERVAGRDTWSLHLTVETAAPQCPRATVGAVAVDIGWRRRPSGELRVAYVFDGSTGREILIDPGVEAGLRQVDSLRSIRDRHFNVAKAFLVQLLGNLQNTPDWLREATRYLRQWRSPARLAGLALRWRAQRFDGDDRCFAGLEAWRHKDKHLWTWETNLRRQAICRRRDQYRVLAAQMADQYRTLIVERFDLRVMQRHVAPESEEREVAAVRWQQRLAATSILRGCLIQAFARRRGVVVELPATNTTRECPYCGTVDKWDQAAELEHRCSKCGQQRDQDAGAAQVLFARWNREQSRGASAAPAEERMTVKDYSDSSGKKASKWGRLGRHGATARAAADNTAKS